MSVESLSPYVFVVLFLIITAFILCWSKTVKNFVYYRQRNPWFAPLILCRTRLMFSFEVVGIALLVLKLAIPGPSQDEYNELLAKAVLANAHSTSLLYQGMRKEIPATIPNNLDATQADLPKTITKAPEKLYDELHTYVRRSSILLASYFGDKLPECRINGRPFRVMNLDPDAELVNIEIARLNVEKSRCDELHLTTGISVGLLFNSLKDTAVEVLGGIFLFFAALLKLAEIREKENSIKNAKVHSKWYWDENNIRW